MSSSEPRATFCRRLLEARVAAGLSQKQLGIKAGLDEFVASTRVNRYEAGVHEPDLNMAERLADAASVPLAYFYADDDQLATVILKFASLSRRAQRALVQSLS
jgi:transcriptional regulator with XRE-family HTH domain